MSKRGRKQKVKINPTMLILVGLAFIVIAIILLVEEKRRASLW